MRYSYMLASAGVLVSSAMATCTTTIPVLNEMGNIGPAGECIRSSSTVTNTRTVDCGGCDMRINHIGGLGLECRGEVTSSGVQTIQTAVCASSTGAVATPTPLPYTPTPVNSVPISTASSTSTSISLCDWLRDPLCLWDGQPQAAAATAAPSKRAFACDIVGGCGSTRSRATTTPLSTITPIEYPSSGQPTGTPSARCSTYTQPFPCPDIVGYPCPSPTVVTRCHSATPTTMRSVKSATSSKSTPSTTCIPELEVFGADVHTIKACPSASITPISSVTSSKPAPSTTCIPELEVFGAEVHTIKACPSGSVNPL